VTATACQLPWQCQRTQTGAQYPNHGDSLTRQELSQVIAAGAASDQAIPAIATFAASRLQIEDFHLACIELAGAQTLLLVGCELTAHAHGEFHLHSPHRALQAGRQVAIGSKELETTVRSRHGTHGDEAASGAARQAGRHALAMPGATGRRP
jgi:hypothetical protein